MALVAIAQPKDPESVAAGGGCGLFIFGSDATLENNLVNGNTSQDRGGGTLDGNVVISNTANGDGGGMVIFGGNTWYNNVVADNHAGGSGSALYIMPAGPDLVHTTIGCNSGGDGTAIYVTSGPIPAQATDVTLAPLKKGLTKWHDGTDMVYCPGN